MSATLASLYEGLLCFSMLTYFSQAQVFDTAIENGQLLQYGHAYQLNDSTNVKTKDACMRYSATVQERKRLNLRMIVQWNGT